MKTKKIDLKSKYSEKIQPLFELDREGYMDDDTLNGYKKFNFTKEDISELIELAMDDRVDKIDYELYEKESNRLFFAGIYAVRVLGKLKAIEALEPLTNKMYLEIENDFYQEAMIVFFADIGVEALDFIENDLLRVNEDKLTLFDGLRKIIEQNEEENERIEQILVKYLEKTEDNSSHLAFAISLLTKISGAKHIELIRKLFEEKEVDVFFYGDLEDIEIKLGLREKRTQPREKNLIEKMLESYELEDKLEPLVSTETKIGRNEPCPCGSGKKYKKCCLNK